MQNQIRRSDLSSDQLFAIRNALRDGDLIGICSRLAMRHCCLSRLRSLMTSMIEQSSLRQKSAEAYRNCGPPTPLSEDQLDDQTRMIVAQFDIDFELS